MIRDWAMNSLYTDNGLADINSSLLEVGIQENASAVTNEHDWQNELDTELFQGYSPALLTFASVCCIIYMMVGVPGNLITIIALFRCKKVSGINYDSITRFSCTKEGNKIFAVLYALTYNALYYIISSIYSHL